MAYKTGGISLNWHEHEGALMLSVIASGVDPDGIQTALADLANALPQLVLPEEKVAEDGGEDMTCLDEANSEPDFGDEQE